MLSSSAPRVNTEFAVVRIDKFLGGGIARYLAPVLNHDWTVWRTAPPMTGDGLTLPLVFGVLLRVTQHMGPRQAGQSATTLH